MSNATLQLQDFRALINARAVGDQALWHELADLLYSIFDSLDSLQTRVNALDTQIKSQQSRGGNAEQPTT